jgi:hypothetical protein
MKTKTALLFGLILMLLMHGCAVYTPYAPGYSYPGYGHQPYDYGWRGGGRGWGGGHHYY